MKVKNIKCKVCAGSIKLLLDKKPTLLQQEELQKAIHQGHSVEFISFSIAKNIKKCTCFNK